MLSCLNRNAGQLDTVNTRLTMQLNQQEEYQRRQQRTNSELLRGLQDLLHAQQHLHHGVEDAGGASPFAGAAAFTAADRASSGGALSPMAGGGGAASAARRINSMAASATSKVFGFSRSGAAVGKGSFSRAGSDLASPTSPHSTAGAAAVPENQALDFADTAAGRSYAGTVPAASPVLGDAVAAPDSTEAVSVMRGLQGQLEQQQRALEQQHQLLEQLLSRLPPQQ
jgi:hypothetical protein